MPKKSDSNQKDIVDALRRMGCFVFSLHAVGKGCPDLLLAHPKTRRWYLAECKNPKYYKYEAKTHPSTYKAQKEFREKALAPVLLLTSPQDAVTWFNTTGTEYTEVPF